MELDTIFEAILNNGFPVVIAIYLLVRMEKKLENLEIAINELSRSIDKMTNS